MVRRQCHESCIFFSTLPAEKATEDRDCQWPHQRCAYEKNSDNHPGTITLPEHRLRNNRCSFRRSLPREGSAPEMNCLEGERGPAKRAQQEQGQREREWVAERIGQPVYAHAASSSPQPASDRYTSSDNAVPTLPAGPEEMPEAASSRSSDQTPVRAARRAPGRSYDPLWQENRRIAGGLLQLWRLCLRSCSTARVPEHSRRAVR